MLRNLKFVPYKIKEQRKAEKIFKDTEKKARRDAAI